MELRQLRYFVRAVELGSIGKAAADLTVVPSALSQQISRLESEMSAILLQRSVTGVEPTPAGHAFFREAKLALRHVEQGIRGAQELRISGRVSVGLTPTFASMVGLELIRSMKDQYGGVQVHIMEGLSGSLANALSNRELDHALLFRYNVATHLSVKPLIQEQLYLFESAGGDRNYGGRSLNPERLEVAIAGRPLLASSSLHGLRQTLDEAFSEARLRPHISYEIDSLPTLMDAVAAGIGVTLQPWSAIARYASRDVLFRWTEIAEPALRRSGDLCSLPDDELSSAAVAARSVLVECIRNLAAAGQWEGVSLVGTRS